MKILFIIGTILFALLLVLFGYCACVISSECSRYEEENLLDEEDLDE